MPSIPLSLTQFCSRRSAVALCREARSKAARLRNRAWHASLERSSAVVTRFTIFRAARERATENLARFNMPLELGMAMARRFMDLSDGHDWLILVPKGHAYLRFVSDLAAYDPATHDGSIEKHRRAVMAWLSTRKDATLRVTPRRYYRHFPTFS